MAEVVVQDAPVNGRPVEDSTSVLDQRRWAGTVCAVEAKQRRQLTAWGDLEDGPTTGVVAAYAAKLGCPVKFSVGRLDHPSGILAVRASALRAEVVERLHLATADFKYRTWKTGLLRRAKSGPEETPVAGLDQRCLRADVLRADPARSAEVI